MALLVVEVFAEGEVQLGREGLGELECLSVVDDDLLERGQAVKRGDVVTLEVRAALRYVPPSNSVSRRYSSAPVGGGHPVREYADELGVFEQTSPPGLLTAAL
ncbi:hypothetical protein [Streptomyces sp. NPDC045470]|uniref:hypothetical protein n=1 Tax=Streptomyces sp. NPDC045470 TaxID=3155469 RepID=UPI0033F8EFB1